MACSGSVDPREPRYDRLALVLERGGVGYGLFRPDARPQAEPAYDELRTPMRQLNPHFPFGRLTLTFTSVK